MILDLDVGNTLTKWRMKRIDSGQIVDRGSVWTRDRWEDSDAVPDFRDIKVMRVSNVAGKEVEAEVERISRRYRVPMHLARSTERFAGVTNGYKVPGQLGVDRWLGVLAGYHVFGGCCVVDCGSAITIDFVLEQGEHLGGFISPGIRLMKESLKLGTRNVPVDPDESHEWLSAPGRCTAEAVSHGIYLAAIGQIKTVYEQVSQKTATQLPVILTGGDAGLIASGIGVSQVWPDMVYAGLELMFPVSASERQGVLSGAPSACP